MVKEGDYTIKESGNVGSINVSIRGDMIYLHKPRTGADFELTAEQFEELIFLPKKENKNE